VAPPAAADGDERGPVSVDVEVVPEPVSAPPPVGIAVTLSLARSELPADLSSGQLRESEDRIAHETHTRRPAGGKDKNGDPPV
jgi:hypothetical protein